MLYSDFVTELSTLLVIPPTDTGFIAILPRCIDYAEQRIYRELDLAATRTRNASIALAVGNRNINPIAGTFITVASINAITPAGAVSPDGGTRNPLTRMSWDLLDAVYGSNAVLGLPRYWAFQDASNIAVGPWPDQAYQVEIVGTFRPTPLSASNTSTVLTLYLPDLFTAAAMVFMSGYMRNFGSQSDNPQMALSWEQVYTGLRESAMAEESRKKLSVMIELPPAAT